MKKEFIIYGIAIAINRGAAIVLMPFLLYVLSDAEFGNYGFVQILMQFFAPILSLNLFTAIAREGADNPSDSAYIYQKTYIRIIIVSIIILIVLLRIQISISFDSSYLFGICLGCIEGLHNMQLAQQRAKENNLGFLFFSVLKTIGLLFISILFYFFTKNQDSDSYLILQFFWFLTLFIIYHKKTIIGSVDSQIKQLKEVVWLSVLIIPHSLAQWLITGSGRYFIKEFLGEIQLGFFSKYYNFAMIIMILNSAIGMVIPQQIIRNYQKWVYGDVKNKFLLYYSLLSLLIYVALIIGFYIDERSFYFLKINYKNIAFEFSFIFGGFYILGFYYFYSNVLFALKKNGVLSMITTLTALFSVIINFFLIKWFSLKGAAISVFITYIVYYLTTAIFGLKYEKPLQSSLKVELLILIITLLVIFALPIKLLE